MKLILMGLLLTQLCLGNSEDTSNMLTTLKGNDASSMKLKLYDYGYVKSHARVITIFHSDNCLFCENFNDQIRDFLKSGYGFILNGVRIVTIQTSYYSMISDLSQLAEWKEKNRIPWAVAINPQSSLGLPHNGCISSHNDENNKKIYTYSSPCVVISKPNNTGKVFSKQNPELLDILKALL